MRLSERVRALVFAVHRTDPKSDEWRTYIRRLSQDVAAFEHSVEDARAMGNDASTSDVHQRIGALQSALDEATAVIDDLLIHSDRLWRVIEATNGVDWRAVEAALQVAGPTDHGRHQLALRRLLRAASEAASGLPAEPSHPHDSPSGERA